MTRRLGPEEERLWKALTDAVAPPDQGRRTLRPDEQRLWLSVTGHAPQPVLKPASPETKAASAPAAAPHRPVLPPIPQVRRPKAPGPLEAIEPGRKRRLIRERDPIDATLDLHGLDQDRARNALERFVDWAFSQDYRSVLVITGKGPSGDGVLRQRTPEWLNGSALRGKVAGYSRADQRHGGEGALYVALKRRTA